MTLKKSFNYAVAVAVASVALVSNSASAAFNGYMNVYQADCGGAPIFGQPWGTADLRASGETSIKLQANTNTYDDNPGDAFWIDAGTGAGAKCMEANYYEETAYPVVPADLTVSITGFVDSNTLTGYNTLAVITVFDGAYNFISSTSDALDEDFTYNVEVDLSGFAGGNLIVQSGFRTVGLNVAGTSAEAAQELNLRVGADRRLGASSAADDPTGIPVLPLWALFGLAGLIGLMGLRRKA
jgi:hypothetical protein